VADRDGARIEGDTDPARVERALSAAGCLAPAGEADALVAAAADGIGPIEALVARRTSGEPLAWVVGWTTFFGNRVAVDPGVFVPRPHSELLTRLAIERLPDRRVAIDLCTGTGAVALAMAAARPGATIIATDVDPAAVANARRNGVDAVVGDLDQPLASMRSRADVVTAVAPYVPSGDLRFLPRDVLANEPVGALDGGPRGTDVARRAVAAAARLLRHGGTVVLEVGGDQAGEVTHAMTAAGFAAIGVHQDEEGHDRAVVGALERTA
jgi:release factor glutamine methyltransferase